MIQLGVLLLLLGLLTGLVVPALAVPRLGVSAHIVGSIGGIFLVVFGLLWPQLRLGPRASGVGLALAVTSFYGGWLMPLLGGVWGAGASMLPFAAGEARGTAFQEGLIAAGLGASAVAVVALCALVLWGLRGSGERSRDGPATGGR
jgi:hydroxylaminobenzene mutase